MNTETGKIVEMSEREAALMEKLTMLKIKEYEVLQMMEEEKRPEELALMRFVEDRKKLKASYGTEVKNAFRVGYRTALKDVK